MKFATQGYEELSYGISKYALKKILKESVIPSCTRHQIRDEFKLMMKELDRDLMASLNFEIVQEVKKFEKSKK